VPPGRRQDLAPSRGE